MAVDAIMRFRGPRLTIINDRPLNNVSGTVDAQTGAPVLIEERKTKFTGMNIGAALADAGYCTIAHKRCDIFERNGE